MRHLLLASLLISGLATPAVGVASSPPSEPYFGVRGSICPQPTVSGRKTIFGVAKVESPVPAPIAELINGFVAAAGSQHAQSFMDSAQIPAKTRASCTAAIVKLKSSEQCKSRPLYLLGDGEIRQSWQCRDQKAYDLFYTVENGRLTNIWAMDATRSPAIIRCRNPKKATNELKWRGGAYVERCED